MTGVPPAGLTAFVHAWANPLHATRFVPMTLAERRELLHGLAVRLAGALVADESSAGAGYDVGVDLVSAGYESPESLGCTLAVINARLLEDLGLAGDAGVRSRLAGLIESLATGFARASRDAVLDAQDALRLAALTARQRAELALRANETRFRNAALHDPLTGLASQMLFIQWLRQTLEESPADARLGLCYLKINGFRVVNHTLGHAVAQRLLRGVAARLGGLAAEGGHRLARLDGDKFAFLVVDTDSAEDVTKVADRALALLSDAFQIDGSDLPVSGGAGVVECPVAEADPEEMMRAADHALHWTKVDGRAGWSLFEPERSARDVQRYRMSATMPAALRRDEFTLAYQPLVGLEDGRLAGVEALARWRHPELGLVRPDEFIPLAETTGLIVPLGAQLLEMACAEAVGWRRGADPGPFVSVNLAVRQIRHPGLIATVAAVLDRTGLPPERLQLEITESALVGDEETLRVLAGLADLGIRLAIDDFGTGYSNLASLYVWPMHGLKLAATFAERLGTGGTPNHDALISAVVTFAHTMNLEVTAEGVETAAQAERLRAMGCETGQGWHFGRPMPPDRFAALLH
jgi:diguanylate cyclase (GGDEF)-like protein